MHRTIFYNQMKKSIGILMLLSNDLSIYSHLHPYTLQCYLKCASIQIRTLICTYIHIFMPNTRVNHNPFRVPIKIPCNSIDTQQKLLLVLSIILFYYFVLLDISILLCINRRWMLLKNLLIDV